MAKKNQVDILDQMHEATMLINEQKKTMDTHRKEMEREMSQHCEE